MLCWLCRLLGSVPDLSKDECMRLAAAYIGELNPIQIESRGSIEGNVPDTLVLWNWISFRWVYMLSKGGHSPDIRLLLIANFSRYPSPEYDLAAETLILPIVPETLDAIKEKYSSILKLVSCAGRVPARS